MLRLSTVDAPSAVRRPRRLLRPGRASSFACAAAVAAIAGSASASAEEIDVQLRGSYVESIVSNGATVPRADLRSGTSFGDVLAHPWGTTIRSADGRNLESYFVRNDTPGGWEVTFGQWTPGPGPAADFFVFEIGGNDSIHVRARFDDGSLGTAVPVDGWSSTSVLADGGPNAGQRAHGLGFRFEDLRRANGAAVTPQDRVVGIRIVSTSIDGAAFLVRDPGVNAGSDGNGAWSITPDQPRTASPMELTFVGPWASETGIDPNPFLDYRLTVRFDGPGGRSLQVPGFFDADGQSGDVGNLWKVRFLPPVPGDWTATASMRSGANVAVTTQTSAGSRVGSIDGRVIDFDVAPIDAEEGGFFRLGNLRDSGKHHRRFDHGPYYVKAGTNGPENFLALRAIDDVTKSGGEGNLHSFEAHRGDWRPGDPVIDPGNGIDDGKGAIGALNYLADRGVNSLFLIVMNLGGDGNDVYPFLGPRRRSFEKLHYDTSRLRQWNVVFEHAQRRGISLSLVLNETEIENELWLDNGTLGTERRLFYREMIARFGHHPAVRWNVCEENDYTANRVAQFADWITRLDADEHAIAVHNNPNDLAMFQALLNNPDLDAASLQFDPNQTDTQVELVRQWTAQAGRPWIVDADEMGPWQIGLTDTNAVDTRKRVLYDALFSGGGVEFYFGWHDLPLGGDLSLEDFRTRDEMWRYVGYARRFVEQNLPFWDMEPRDSFVRNESSNFGGAEVYALPGEVYAIYYPRASNTGQLNLQGFTDPFEVQWFDPRNGVEVGSPIPLGSGGWKNVGDPPNSRSEDWVALVRRFAPLTADRSTGSVGVGHVQRIQFRPGTPFAGRTYFLLSTLSGTSNGFDLGGLFVPINFDRWTRYGLGDAQGTVFENQLGVLDANGEATINVRLDPAYVSGLVGTTMVHCAITANPYDYASNVISLRVLP
ncbi:MAG: DUF5060 domain-containing protein [Planctomycetota bacterium]